MKNKRGNASINPSKVRVFIYFSTCCKEPARKPPCERSLDDRRERKFSRSGLGHWRCSKCAKPCKVLRARISDVANNASGGQANGPS